MKTKEFKPGDLVETYSLGYLLRKRIVIKNVERNFERDPLFKFNETLRNPGFNNEMLRGVFGTVLKVGVPHYPLENTVAVESNWDGTTWYLPLETIKK